MTRLRAQGGQSAVLTVLFLVALLGMAALVVDVGAWFRAHRAAQAAADAAALAGAQALPESTPAAAALALAYANKNGGGLQPQNIGFEPDLTANDTISVRIHRDAPTFFSRVFGFELFRVSAPAKARAAAPVEARWAAPFAVDEQHEYLSGSGCPCWNRATELDLKKTGPGAFRVINLDRSRGGIGQSTLAGWILKGFDGLMPLGWYFSDPGAKFNPSQIQSALSARIGDELLFPVYRSVKEEGANFQYDIVGWAGFSLTGYDARGSSGRLFGSFTRIIWEGIQSESSSSADFGVRTISLVE